MTSEAIKDMIDDGDFKVKLEGLCMEITTAYEQDCAPSVIQLAQEMQDHLKTSNSRNPNVEVSIDLLHTLLTMSRHHCGTEITRTIVDRRQDELIDVECIDVERKQLDARGLLNNATCDPFDRYDYEQAAATICATERFVAELTYADRMEFASDMGSQQEAINEAEKTMNNLRAHRDD